MCLAIPAKIINLDEDGNATVDILGINRDISVALLPLAKKGDYVLVHAGFGIEVIDEENAAATLELIAEFPEIAGLDKTQSAVASAKADVARKEGGSS